MSVDETKGEANSPGSPRSPRSPLEGQVVVEEPGDAWTRLNEYALRRSFCGLRSQTNCPLRVICTVLQLTVLFASISLAVLTFYVSPRLYSTNPLLFWFIVVTLVGEVCLLLAIGAILSGLRLCVGPHNVSHALAASAISMKCWQGILYYSSLGIGTYLLATSFPLSSTGVPISAAIYVALETALSILYVVFSLPALCGIMGYVCHKIQHKVFRHPVVEFQRRYSGDDAVIPAYAAVSGQPYLVQLSNMMPSGQAGRPRSPREESRPLVEEHV